jgi:N-acetyltransferase
VQHDLTLSGPGVRLVPLGVEHAATLASFVDERVWRGMTTPTPRGEADMLVEVERALATPARYAFAVVDEASDRVVGSTSFYDVDRRMGRLEVGHTFYAPVVWGTHVNPACKLALLTHAFDAWDMHRVAFRADARNARSLAAVARLGAVEEGRLRGHRVAPDGSRGDSVYFSVLADEWPQVRARLLTRLSAQAPAAALDTAADAGNNAATDKLAGAPVAPTTGEGDSHVVLIGGRSGVGKTSVAHALHALLIEADVRHAVIEGDYLDLAHPAPHAERLTERNLRSVWSAYRELGYRRLVYTNTVSPQYADDLAAAMGDHPRVTAVLLTAADETAHARLAQRESGEELRRHVERSDAAARALERGCLPSVHRVDSGADDPEALAHRIATLAGWLPAP